MKKQKLQGFNGIVNGSYGSFNQYSGDVLVNYRLNKFNLFAGINLQNRSMRGTGSSERGGDVGELCLTTPKKWT